MNGKNENFSHVAKINGFSLTGRIKLEDSPAEAEMELDVKTNADKSFKLKCFSYETEPDDLHTGKLRIGDNVRMRFTLSTGVHNVTMLEQKEKSITFDVDLHKRSPRATPHYIVSGEILRIKSHPDKEMAVHKKRIILDCGIYLTTAISVKSDLNVGDYIRTSGRLDGFVVEKMK